MTALFAIPRSLQHHRHEQEDHDRVDEVDDDVCQLDLIWINPVADSDIQVETELRDDAAELPCEAKVSQIYSSTLFAIDLLDLIKLPGVEVQAARQSRRVNQARKQRGEQQAG